MIYWYKNPDYNNIIIKNADNYSIEDIIIKFKKDLYIYDSGNSGEQTYEIVFWDEKIIKIVQLFHYWDKSWDDYDYCYEINNHFSQTDIPSTQDQRLTDVDYILLLKMGVKI